MRVHLVDGTFELFRAYFAVPEGTAKDGTEVGATRGLLRGLAKLVRDPQVTHVGVAFDHVVESFRNDLFDGYKTGEGLDPLLFAQFPLAERAAAALGLTVWPMVEFEADDAIASAAAVAAADPRVAQVVICSPDKDFAQCVQGDRVVTWDRIRNVVRNADEVRAKFGVPPAAIPDWLALVGDTADGIPGLAGWGAKSAATVLSHYGTIEAIPDAAHDWGVKVRGAARLAQVLAEQRTEAKLYKRLATLRLDAPVFQPLAVGGGKAASSEAMAAAVDQLAWQGAKTDDLVALCDDLRMDVPQLS